MLKEQLIMIKNSGNVLQKRKYWTNTWKVYKIVVIGKRGRSQREIFWNSRYLNERR